MVKCKDCFHLVDFDTLRILLEPKQDILKDRFYEDDYFCICGIFNVVEDPCEQIECSHFYNKKAVKGECPNCGN